MTFLQFAYRNVLRNRRVYAAYFMASSFSVMVFFIYSMLLFHPSIENQFIQEIAFLGMAFADVVLVIFTLFFLLYSLSAFLQARSKEFGILQQLGMDRGQLQKLVFVETMILGVIALIVGIFFGYIFTKFFFMIVKAMLVLDALPLYFSLEPFLLTGLVFLTLFALISFAGTMFIRQSSIANLVSGGAQLRETTSYSKVGAILGFAFLLVSYSLVIYSLIEMNVWISPVIILCAIVGSYFFFKDSLLSAIVNLQRYKHVYWRSTRIVTFSDALVKIRENSRMFFIVTMVSTVAIISVGVVASLTSFANQYRESNPISVLYVSNPDNPFEQQHIDQLTRDFYEQNLTYTLLTAEIVKQTSAATRMPIQILSESDVNAIAVALKEPLIDLSPGEGLRFGEWREQDSPQLIHLRENTIYFHVEEGYTHFPLPTAAFDNTAYILSDEDFSKIENAYLYGGWEESVARIFAFHVPDWLRTEEVGLTLDREVIQSYETETPLPYYFDNPGLNYSYISSTFSLLLVTGLLVAAVLVLAAGSFIYFKFYTNLEMDRRQFEALRHMGFTNEELRSIADKQLLPQFFLPWGLAMLHATFSFLFLQAVWVDIAAMSIAMEMLIVLGAFTLIQFVYYYLIRWRYLAHLQLTT